MNDLMKDLMEKAARNPKRIAFPEAGNPDILRLCEAVCAKGLGTPVLMDSAEAVEARAKPLGIRTEGFAYFDCADEDRRRELSETLLSQRDELTEKAVLRKAKDPVRCGLLMLKAGLVDGVAAGREYATGQVIFEAIGIVGLLPGVESPSSLGLADIPGFAGGENGLLALADCAINPAPDAKDLAGIAISSAETVRNLLGWEPRVALLSFSTCGSADHESLEPVREAVETVRRLRPDIQADGEFQLDSALLPETAAAKVPRESAVAGKANVLIFPNLHAGNIGVKMIQIFGKANAYGPVLQGFRKPVCDFSRSAPVEEMLGNVAMLVLQTGKGDGHAQ